MPRISTIVVVATVIVAACTPRQMTYAEAREYCQEKADAAAGPQGEIGVSTGTSGTNFSFGISVSDSFLRGDDPNVVYDTCMNELSANGQISGVAE